MSDFDIAAVDEVIHGRIRLGVMACLIGGGGSAEFSDLRQRLGASDGNLSVHLSKLEAAGYVRIEKTYAGKRPLTRAHLTPAGRKAFAAYLDALGAVLDGAGAR